MTALACRVCGCSDNEPCFISGLGLRYSTQQIEEIFGDEQLQNMQLAPCTWVESNLCSACLEAPPPPLLFDALGAPLRGAP